MGFVSGASFFLHNVYVVNNVNAVYSVDIVHMSNGTIIYLTLAVDFERSFSNNPKKGQLSY